MKLLHLSDIHITAPGATIADRDPRANFEAALDHALSRHADADLLAITGDLSDWGDAPDYEWLKDRLARVPIPVGLCIGNHDDRATFLSVFPDHRDADGYVQTSLDIDGYRCLFIDTWGPETHAGHFCEARRAWLVDALERADRPVLIFMHHNPMPSGIAPVDEIRLLDDAPFRAIVGGHRDTVRHVFFGHCHLPMNGSINGVPATSGRGTNHASWPGFEETEMLCASDLPAAYSVALVEPDYITVQMVEFGYEGAIRAEGSPDYAAWNRETMVR